MNILQTIYNKLFPPKSAVRKEKKTTEYQITTELPWKVTNVKILQGRGWFYFQDWRGKHLTTVYVIEENENTELRIDFYSEVCDCGKQMFVKLSEVDIQ